MLVLWSVVFDGLGMKRWRGWLGRHFPAPYQVHPRTLVFRSSSLESRFGRRYDLDAVFLSRLALICGLLVYSVFGVFDYFLLPEHYRSLWIIRFGLGVPVLLLAIALSCLPGLRRYNDWLLLLVAQVMALTLVAMLHVVEGAASMHFVAGLMLLLVFNFVAFRMRAWIATLSGLLIILLFFFGTLIVGATDGVFLLGALLFLVSIFLPLVFGAVITELFARQFFVRSLQLDELANTDALTRLPNRRAFMSRLQEELSRHQRYGAPFALAMVDADHFKRINDEHGHAAGDDVLRELGRRFRALFRDSDLVARLGGEEFAVILAHADADGARQVCERVRAAVADTPIHLDDEQSVSLSISIGIVVPDGDIRSVDALLRQADNAMYRAKGEGRDQVIMAG